MKIKVNTNILRKTLKVRTNRINQVKYSAKSESMKLIKDEIKKEMRSDDKAGVLKSQSRIRRFRVSPIRRSASGQSAARDTGLAEKSIVARNNADGFSVSFRGKSGKYMAILENALNRPTLRIVRDKTLSKIKRIFNKNLKNSI